MDFPSGTSCPLGRPAAVNMLPQSRQGTFATRWLHSAGPQKRLRGAGCEPRVKRGAARKKACHFIPKQFLPANPTARLGEGPRARAHDMPASVGMRNTKLVKITLPDSGGAQVVDFAKTQAG